MEKWWFNSMLSKEELERRCVLSKSIGSLGPIENTRRSKNRSLNYTEKKIHSWSDSDSSGYSNVDHLFGVRDIRNLISDDTFLVRDSKGDSYSIYFDIENQIFQIDNDYSFLSELQISNYWNSSYLNTGSKNDDSYYDRYMYNTKYRYRYSWNNHINSCIDRYLHSQMCIKSSVLSGSGNYSDSYIFSYICSVSKSSCIRTVANGNSSDLNKNDNDFNKNGNSSDLNKNNNDNSSDLNKNNNDNDFNNNDLNKNKNDNSSDFNKNDNDNSSDLNKNDNDNSSDLNKNDNDNSSDLNKNDNDNSSDLNKNDNDFNKNDFNNYDFNNYDNDLNKNDFNNYDFNNYDNDLNKNDFNNYGSDLNNNNNGSLNVTQKYKHLWILCENCYTLNYKKIVKCRLYICEQCGYHLKMSSSERIELSIDPGTWNSMDEDMVSIDPIEFHSEEESYKDRIHSYQGETGLTEAVQTGIGQLNGIPVAIGVMDFQFIGGSMGSVVGEKITRLIEYATKKFLPLIIVCASGGARMQEGSLSLMQMAKIASALYDYQSNKKLFYVSILTSPTTGGVTASFGMLGDIIIAEPNAYIAFAGKRVIEEILKEEIPEGSQEAEYLFDKGIFDPIVPRNLLKDVLSELFQLHTFFPLNQAEH
uniref:Acetyl-coenzyme A carboxylase carboxyl transferase subunit beta n=1 Tax=Dioncophyllum thollonii TaxID=122299 RepID=A0A411JQV1_9CARY|nr:acetyl-CoA carboxylase carboxyltransferase beta subunit [Dioncophyllum thollonii]QBC67443.1 acetyl-CoA carboxylase carboxyltransferase beta subunit [Dioncophyllum thollonii]